MDFGYGEKRCEEWTSDGVLMACDFRYGSCIVGFIFILPLYANCRLPPFDISKYPLKRFTNNTFYVAARQKMSVIARYMVSANSTTFNNFPHLALMDARSIFSKLSSEIMDYIQPNLDKNFWSIF